MKKIIAFVMLAAFFIGPVAFATQHTAPVAVSATIPAACSVNGGTLAFGILPGGDVLNTLAAPDPTFTCPNGTPYTVIDDNGLNEIGVVHRLNNGLGNLIPYTFDYTAAGVANGASTAIGLSGDILGVDYAGKPDGVYNDTVTIEVNI